MIKSFRINYIDGGDMRYKSFETPAIDETGALSSLWDRYEYGDFENRVVEVIELPEPVPQRMRIGSPAPLPYSTI